jgi:hypothetical protein
MFSLVLLLFTFPHFSHFFGWHQTEAEMRHWIYLIVGHDGGSKQLSQMSVG